MSLRWVALGRKGLSLVAAHADVEPEPLERVAASNRVTTVPEGLLVSGAHYGFGPRLTMLFQAPELEGFDLEQNEPGDEFDCQG